MTNGEAIERIKVIRWEHATNKCPDREALDIAIKALEEGNTCDEREKGNCPFYTARGDI